MGLLENGEKSSVLENAILIAGPTASGKSALALRVARAVGGAIVNADSMQVYSVLDRLTARPDATDLAAVPHRLYGHVDPGADYSTGHWVRDVRALIEAGASAKGRPIFCGGTGLYFRALIDGLSAMPDIPDDIRGRWRGKLADEGPESLHRILQRDDPDAASRLQPSDGQRIARALEVLDASGRSILAWQGQRAAPLVDRASATMIVLAPDRAELDRRIAERFAKMLDSGAVDEVRQLRSLDLDPAQPAMKAIGVREIGDYLDEKATITETLYRVRISTRQYAKRQSTWFRNQLGPEWRKISDISVIADKSDDEISAFWL